MPVVVDDTGFASATARVHLLTRQQIAATAISANAKVMAAAPIPRSVERHVDGVKDAPEEAVKPGGVIVYDYGRIDQVALFALDTLRQLSPVDQGDYVRSHVIMLNSVVVDNSDNPSSQTLAAWKPGDRITISNLMPYTRKIEIGNGRYRAHGHVYEKAVHIVNGRFGNIANTSFTYEKAPAGGGPDGIRAWAWNSKRTLFSAHEANPQKQSNQEWLTRQPTLVIVENS